MRALAGVLLLLLAVLGQAASAGAAPSDASVGGTTGRASADLVRVAGAAAPAPEAPSDGAGGTEELPPDVAEWFDVEAEVVVRSGAAAILPGVADSTVDRVVVERGRPVRTWSEELLAGRSAGEVLTSSTRYVAALTLDGTGVGVLVLDTSGSSYTGEVRHVPGLAAALLALPDDRVVVHDERTQAWYSYGSGRVAPLDEAAGERLAGSADLVSYLPYLLDPEGPPAEAAADGGGPWPVVIGAAAVGAVLLAAAVAVWLRREEDEDQPTERDGLMARIRAELRSGRPGSWSHRG